MITSTTGSVEGKRITQYHGIVAGDAVMGANFVRDFFARVTDVVGGRSGAYQKELRKARSLALEDLMEEAAELGANAVVGINLDTEVMGESMLMVVATGTAVTVE
ncbi:heavy metal-binding domain-containing protein [Sneathiella sp. P13V-1]|uniref:heavy metal-binding domain-containing protein n=1 Tax=Sneathiella sp. P13V-1 TaxID=2697366 RepID=UPI00187BA1D6|nr:heavy metal-binding domain-containing protein [Sneathiella sp. P13V-1]MBE7636233.1 heavy metal-binding domain-containing protein [Sneathiella sp. P13V-1]